jgi:1-acyl-sn-glycerol-3-phosphate acyltransferase
MRDSLVRIYQLFIAFLLLTLSGVVALSLRIVSVGLLVEFNRKYLVPFSSKLTMWMVGITLDLPNHIPVTGSNYFITFNHNSYLDGFALTALGLTRTHFLLSEKMLKLIPLTFSSLGIGVLYIPQKKHHARRMRFFERLERRIMKNNVNVAGSSEGVHAHTHSIAPFNKGVYHMAMICKMKIIPLFIYVPMESNPFDKYKAVKKGTIRIEVMDTIETVGWTVETLEANKEKVRDMYVKRFNEVHNTEVA